MTPINENTSGKIEARRALIESKQASHRADALIDETRIAFEAVKTSRTENHFTDKFRAIIQGGYRT